MENKTLQQIFDELDSLYPELTESINGSTFVVSQEKRTSILMEWATETFEKQTQSGFLVSPEGYYLSTNREAENEFNKLITLIRLGLDSNRFSNDSQISIWDKDGVSHYITVSRFLEIMVDYGLFCYTNR